ncbi:unnamed protein product [Sphenostylis stenocarpa]|uniref:Uncharacterized protein n=1 Tax=Sphenostylis stenocarpa TaxID=92480 RepID=A0AA86SMW5_9FABA|nr:unnamed protein product [Sphenostylis stenocarpa]
MSHMKQTETRGNGDQLTTTTVALPFIKENLVGFGWKLFLLRKSWLEGGLIICKRIAFNELALAGTDGSQRLEVRGKDRATARGGFLCLLQRKAPGCVLGEHRHVRDEEPSRSRAKESSNIEEGRIVTEKWESSTEEASISGRDASKVQRVVDECEEENVTK